MPVLNALCLLQGHKSFVKGLAWDPVGTYLASAADDKCVIIWRTDGWQPVATITTPFRHGFSTSTFFLRLDWAPCECPAGNTWAVGRKCTDRTIGALTESCGHCRAEIWPQHSLTPHDHASGAGLGSWLHVACPRTLRLPGLPGRGWTQVLYRASSLALPEV